MSPKVLKTLWGVPFKKSTINTLPSIYSGFEVAISFANFDKDYFVQSL